jgi:GNAT superfamily N-acetyltransferase
VSAPGNAWYLRSDRLPRGRWRVRCYQNDWHPDGKTVAADIATPLPDAEQMLWSADVDGSDRSRIVVTETGAPAAPLAWFVALEHRELERPRLTLVAFATDHLPDGTVVSDATFFSMPVTNASQAAAIRWWADTAVVDEIFVQPEFRRTHLGSKLIYTASGYHQHNGLPDRLHSDGRRTDLGQQFVVGLRHPQRMARWTEKAAPMDRHERQPPR